MKYVSDQPQASVFYGLATYIALALPWSRAFLEAHPSSHMLVQLPLLALCGYFISAIISRTSWEHFLQRFDPQGILGFCLIVFTLLFWMLPRSLDAAIETNLYELGKFISIPLFIGMPLKQCWPLVPQVLRGFATAQFIAMLAFLGWLYSEAPVRICNNYLEGAQQELGGHLLLIALMLAAFFGWRRLTCQHSPTHLIQIPTRDAKGTTHVPRNGPAFR